ncbi:hypothetical protein ENBRE01_0357 [Enteropsectra breve]|nr:hypothetical protein ENBRE01_0357 [Enteropsectra breve]
MDVLCLLTLASSVLGMSICRCLNITFEELLVLMGEVNECFKLNMCGIVLPKVSSRKNCTPPPICPCIGALGISTPVFGPSTLIAECDEKNVARVCLQYLLSIPEFGFYYKSNSFTKEKCPVSHSFKNIVSSAALQKQDIDVSELIAALDDASAATTPTKFVETLFAALKREDGFIFEKFPEIYSMRYFTRPDMRRDSLASTETHITVSKDEQDLKHALSKYFKAKQSCGLFIDFSIYLAVEIRKQAPRHSAFIVEREFVVDASDRTARYEIIGIIAQNHDNAPYYGIFQKGDKFVMFGSDNIRAFDSFEKFSKFTEQCTAVLLKRKM